VGGWGSLDEEEPDPRQLVAQTNSLLLIDYTRRLIDSAIEADGRAPITPTIIRTMNEIAMRGLIATSGQYRDGPVKIENSKHVPPAHTDVPRLVEEMCGQFDIERGDEGGELRVAAYALWRLNWIHPFEDGNGRVARALTQFLLSVDLKLPLMPGRGSLPARILEEPRKYWRCLEAADDSFKRRKKVNVQNLQGFLEKHLRALLREGVPST
jgi:Fic family protein